MDCISQGICFPWEKYVEPFMGYVPPRNGYVF